MNPERYFLNKEYFDSSLIELLERQTKQIENQKFTIEVYKATVAKHKAKITAMHHKIKDLESINKTLKLNNSDKEMTIEEIQKQIEEITRSLSKDLEELATENEILHKENKDLKDELKKYKKKDVQAKTDSTNSSLPPSQDFGSTRKHGKKSQRNRGGQAGHPVHRSSLSDKPDQILELVVKQAPSGTCVRIVYRSSDILYECKS